MSSPVENMVDGKTKVILAVPIYKDGGDMGVLGASYNVGALNPVSYTHLQLLFGKRIRQEHFLEVFQEEMVFMI